MEECISNCQFAFVGQRQILDVALVGNEIIEECGGKKPERWVIKVDFEKAYDRID